MEQEKTFEEKLKYVTFPLVLISLFLGIVGFLCAGTGFLDALFMTLQMYAMNMGDKPANVMIEIARFLAPLSLATVLISETKPLACWVRDKLYFLFGKTVIYSDTADGEALYKDMNKNHHFKKVVLTNKSKIYKRAKQSIIMMKNDEDSLTIFKEIKDKKGVRLCLYSLEPNLIPSTGDTVIFNVYDIISGCFWHKSLRLTEEFYDQPEKEYKIMIIGFDTLGQRILYKGLLTNLYSCKQKISYLVYNNSNSPESQVNYDYYTHIMNQDEVIIQNGWPDSDVIKSADAVVITTESSSKTIQQILYATSSNSKVFYYSPSGVNIEDTLLKDSENTDKYEFERLFGFGHHYTGDNGINKQIISEKMLFNNGLLEEAKTLHYNYLGSFAKESKDNEWRKLCGFDKGANLNAVDYAEIGWPLLNVRSEEEMAELEHIRWCRYYFLNHWEQGEVDEGEKNRKERIHKNLIPYKNLSEDIKEKNMKTVRLWKA